MPRNCDALLFPKLRTAMNSEEHSHHAPAPMPGYPAYDEEDEEEEEELEDQE